MMKQKFYFKSVFQHFFLITVTLTLITMTGKAQSFTEGFAVVSPLPAGWAQQNLSSPIGILADWFQGNDFVFAAQNGATTSYAACNFNCVTGANTISNWLFAPTVT